MSEFSADFYEPSRYSVPPRPISRSAAPVRIDQVIIEREAAPVDTGKGMRLFAGILAGAAIVGLTLAAITWYNNTHSPEALARKKAQQKRTLY